MCHLTTVVAFPDMTIEMLKPGWVPMPHPVFVPPPGDAPLWRYMDLTKFIALLERRALFFAALRNLPDKFEGSLSALLRERAEARGVTDSMELGIHFRPPG